MTRLEPWLSVNDVQSGIDWYADAFGADVAYRLDDDNGRPMVVTLSIDGAKFWLQEGSGTARSVLVADDPDRRFDQAVAAGATVFSPVSDEHGWRTGHCVDPFGHHWDIGRPL